MAIYSSKNYFSNASNSFSWGNIKESETKQFISNLMNLIYRNNKSVHEKLNLWSDGSFFTNSIANKTFDEFCDKGNKNNTDYYYYNALIQLVSDYKNVIPCNIIFKKARNFNELINLIHTAETKLINIGVTDNKDRIQYLRGIYYGTAWGLDFSIEKSNIRNNLFNYFTHPAAISIDIPNDPRPYLNCELFKALFDSAEIKKNTDGRAIDWGHVIIGLESRLNFSARNVKLIPFGGTGLECNTWLGDLGGAAGTLAKRRTLDSDIRAITLFPLNGSSFASMVNLEGNIASYVIGRDISNPDNPNEPTNIIFHANQTISSVFQNYLGINSPSEEWHNRAKTFLKMIGGSIDGNNLTNRTSLVNNIATQIETFGSIYIIKTIFKTTPKEELINKINSTSLYITGASLEVASIFIDTLIYSMNHSNALLTYRTNPNPTPKALIGSSILDNLYNTLNWSVYLNENIKDVVDKLIDRAYKLYHNGF